MNLPEEKKLTAEDVWAMFAETDRRMRETDRKFAETAQQMRETDRKLARTEGIVNKLSNEISGLSRNAGLHAEQYFQDALGDCLAFGGQKYDNMIPNLKYHRKKNNQEFDIVLVNGKNLALIEAKNRIRKDFVKELAEKKLVNFKKCFPKFCNCNIYLGIAGFSFETGVLEEAKKRGIGIIRQVGKSIEMSKEKLKAY